MAEVATKFEDEFTKQQQKMPSKPHLTLFYVEISNVIQLESIWETKPDSWVFHRDGSNYVRSLTFVSLKP